MTPSPAERCLSLLTRSLEDGAPVLSCPVPQGRARALAGLQLGNFTVFWEDRVLPSAPAPASQLAGLDAAWVIALRAAPDSAEGTCAAGGDAATLASRLGRCQQAMRHVLNELALPEELSAWVRFFGGSAFTEGRDGSGCWADFGEARFILPRYLYVDHPEGARLVVIARSFDEGFGDLAARSPGAEDPAIPDESNAPVLPTARLPEGAALPERAALLEGAARCLEIIFDSSEEHRSAPREEAPLSVLERRTSADPRGFGELVEAARQEISAGVVSKVVAARRETLTLSAAPNLRSVLDRLAADAPGCTRFLFRIGQRAFLGATPELLVRTRGSTVETEGLAGTAALPPGGDALEVGRALLASEKDRREHAFVVAALRETLTPLCDEITLPAEPEIRQLSRLVHLWTPLRARQRGQLSVLELVARLHPTPAVGGLPRGAALEFIRRHEAAERGWYAAPLGWVDARGDGCFVVALRSALLHQDKVHLFAGAGIVADSRPAAEFAETELKLGAMQRALGIA